MQERYELENLEQLRAISDILRVRIIDLLREQSMTVTQLGEALGVVPAKIHYHVRELERVGLLRLVETREKGGILEKYYLPIAHDIEVPSHLLNAMPSNETLSLIRSWFDQVKERFLSAMREALQRKEQEPFAPQDSFTFSMLHMYMTKQEHEEMMKKMQEMMAPFEVRRGIEGEQEQLGALVLYPQKNEGRYSEASVVTSKKSTSKQIEWMVGTVVYSTADLERVHLAGKKLDITVIGVCQFEKSVSAELVEQVVERFHLIGKLQASVAVRAVLEKKRA